MKRNKLRKVYLAYLIAIGEMVCAAIIICAGYIPGSTWQAVIRILGIAGAVILPVTIYVMYRWIRRDNADTSDELEQMLLIKALAAAGFASMTLMPVLVLLTFIFSEWAGVIMMGYTALVWGTFKLTTYRLYKKY